MKYEMPILFGVSAFAVLTVFFELMTLVTVIENPVLRESIFARGWLFHEPILWFAVFGLLVGALVHWMETVSVGGLMITFGCAVLLMGALEWQSLYDAGKPLIGLVAFVAMLIVFGWTLVRVQPELERPRKAFVRC